MFESLDQGIENAEGKKRNECEVVLRWVAIIVASFVVFSALILAVWFLG